MRYLQAVTEQVSAAPALSVVLFSAVLAAGLAWLLWFVVGHPITLAHEGGHALLVVLLGGQVARVELNADQTGGTSPVNPELWDRNVPVLAIGYLSPSLFGLLGAVILANGHPKAVLWISVLLIVLILTVARRLFTFVVILTTGLVLFLTATQASPQVQLLVACTWVWLLLAGGIVQVLEDGTGASDLLKLRRRTWIPATLWFLFSMIITVSALGLASLILLGVIDLPSTWA